MILTNFKIIFDYDNIEFKYFVKSQRTFKKICSYFGKKKKNSKIGNLKKPPPKKKYFSDILILKTFTFGKELYTFK